MTEGVSPAKAPARHSQSRRVLSEGGWVLVAGIVFALFANLVSPTRLKLTTDYFPKIADVQPAPALATNPIVVGTNTNSPATATNNALARLRAKGLQPLEHTQAVQVFRDPQYASELAIFVDARDDEHYQAGHVPGAYQFFHYRPENYLMTVLPPCQIAQKIVVYCNGGDCEDSEFAAVALSQAGVPLEKLFVYAGGFTEWTTNNLPVELGVRKSGVLKELKR